MNLDIFNQYVKDLKPTASEEYVYITRDNFFGDIIYSVNSSAINFIKIPELADSYFGKMYSIDCITKSTPGFEAWFGVLNDGSYTYQYCCRHMLQKKAEFTLGGFKNDLAGSNNIQIVNNLNEDPMFYNNILLRKSSEGAGRFIYKDKVMYIAPCMLPGSKSTPIDMTIYDRAQSNYFIVVFVTHKKTNDVTTLMRFLKVDDRTKDFKYRRM